MIKEAMFYNPLNNNRVSCFLCNHKCNIADNDFGICRVRQNRDGKLYSLVYGKIIAAHIDPIEKKPLFHFLPGTLSFSIATIGCNFQCGFCQNWQISQYSRQKNDILGEDYTPEAVVKIAHDNNCPSISYTYTEPTIFFEFAYDCAKLAKAKGIRNAFVSNGYMTKEAIYEIHPYLDAANIDLKSFSDDFYRDICKAKLQPVLDSIKLMKELDIWVEVTTLIVPGENDSQEELTKIAEFISSIDKNMPWHISRFHPDHRMINSKATPMETLLLAREIGRKSGLKNIYVGNVWSQDLENTYCVQCQELLIRRSGFNVIENKIKESKCPECKSQIAGKW